MKIVLVRPNYDSHIITPPLGIGYLSSYLNRNGVSAVIIDGLRDHLSPEDLLKKILMERPDAVGITCLTSFYNEAVDLSLKLKKENLKVIFGGVHPTILPRETLADSQCDFVILGEGESALLRLAKNRFENDKIPGVYSLEDAEGKDVVFQKAEIIQNLDELPFPDWNGIDPNRYPQAPHGAIVKHFPIGVITSTRGCPYACTFCASPRFYGRKIRFRSPENVVDEIQFLVEKFGVREIHFEDDNLTLRREHIEKICRLILQRNISISWACPNGIRADTVDGELIALMKKSGCYYFAYGVESANPHILENIKKHETIESIQSSITLAAEHGISCQGFFILGLPGETAETLEETIQFAKRSKLARAQFLILDVLPGSELWETLRGKFEPNWSKKSYKEPEWIPAGLTKELLQQGQSRAFREFYLKSPWRLAKLALSIKLGQIKYLAHRLVDYRILGKK